MTRSIALLCGVVLLALVAAAAASSSTTTTVAADDLAAEVVTTATRAGGRALLTKCPKYFTPDSNGRCVCRPGYEYKSSTKKCYPCQAGYYKTSRGNGSCKQCSSGQYVNYKGATKCLGCPGLVDPSRTYCQRSCKRPDDRSVIHFGPFWSVNWFTYYLGGPGDNFSTAAQVCDSLRNAPNGGKHLIPAVIKSSQQAKVAAKLADYAFKCNDDGKPYDHYAWVLKGYDTPYPKPSYCNWFYHYSGKSKHGKSFPLPPGECYGPTTGEYLPVLCTQGCARYCVKCGSHNKCQTCLDGYKSYNGVCKRYVPEN